MILPLPTYNEPDDPLPPRVDEGDEKRDAWIKWYLDCPNWKCKDCGATMMGRMKYCVYCKYVLKKDDPPKRPISYVENTWTGETT